METLRFKQLPHFRCGASVPWFLLLTSYFSIFPLRSNRFSLREFAARQMLRSRRLSEFRRDPIISPLILFPGTEVPGYFLFVAMRRRAPPDLSDSLQPDIRRRLFLPEVKQPYACIAQELKLGHASRVSRFWNAGVAPEVSAAFLAALEK
jgi:hypothetical protein